MVMCEGRLWPRTRVNAYQPDKKLRIRLSTADHRISCRRCVKDAAPYRLGVTRTTINPFLKLVTWRVPCGPTLGVATPWKEV